MHYLKNHPGMWLNDSAGPDFDAYEDKYGIIPLSDAGRLVSTQQHLIDLWHIGGPANRPPYLFQPFEPAEGSNHVKNGGQAIDTPQYEKFKQHCQEFGFVWLGAGDPVHFDHKGGRVTGGGTAPSSATQVTRDRQNWLNTSRSAGLVVDGVEGPATKAAYKAYQTFLKAYGYTGTIDGIWGSGTQAAHAKFYAAFNAPKPGAQPSAGVPSGLRWQGIQEMLKRLYGYTGAIDGIAGSGTITAFQRFLTTSHYNPGAVDGVWGPNTAKAAQRWLAARWGYKSGIDGVFGAGTKAAWATAERENAAAY